MSGHKDHAPAIGIDLGTTYSCVAFWKNDRIEIIPNDQGHRTTRSCVAYTQPEKPENSHRLVGDAAEHQALKNLDNTIFDAKRLIGLKFNDKEVKAYMKSWPNLKVIKGPSNEPKIVVTYKGKTLELCAEEITSAVLCKMKENAEAFIGKKVKDAVITIPAHFNDSQRRATKDAGIVAGLNVIRTITETTAAVTAYGLDNKSDNADKRNVLVFNLGGGTFDVTLMTIENGKILVKATGGDAHLGGVDFDNHLVDHCVKEFRRRNHKDLSGDSIAMWKLRSACEKAKRILSSTTETSIEVDSLYEKIDFSLNISRAKFENLNMHLFHKCMEKVRMCLSDAKVTKALVHQVILAGGSTRIPKVQHMLQEYFPGNKLCKKLHLDEAVASGAAVFASKLSGNTHKNLPDLVLHDVTPISLGIEVRGHIFDIVIPRNTRIPTSKTKTYVTSQDNQTEIDLEVYQGERSRATDNYFLGEMKLSGIPPAPKGISDIKTSFEKDANGILKVTAMVISTGKAKKLEVSHKSGRLTEEQIRKMQRDTEKYRVEDQEFKKKAKERNALEDYIYEVRNEIENHNVKMRVSPKDFKEMKQAIDKTSKWFDDHQDATFEELQLTKANLEVTCKPLLHV